MSVSYLLSRAGSLIVVAAFASALTGAAAIAASQFDGTWITQDTKGKSFHITSFA